MALNPSIRYAGKSAAPDADYPYGGAQNITVTGDGLGTPWEKDGRNDIWGFQQELLDKAGIVPTNVADKVGASQYVEALRKIAGFPGTIQPYALNDDPAVFGVRLLLLDGSGILVANYPDLVTNAAVPAFNNGVAFTRGAGYYRADNADGSSPNSTGAYLILPDMRGKFLRGMDPTAIHDPDGASRMLGEPQTWAMYDHQHHVEDAATGAHVQMYIDLFTVALGAGSKIAQGDATTVHGAVTARAITDNANVAIGVDNASAAESRPVNDVANWGIWY